MERAMTESDESLLIEYLDGELPPEKCRQIDQRLQNEPALQKQLDVLAQTWHCLDLLEAESPSPQLTAKTMTLAVCGDVFGQNTGSHTGAFVRCGIVFSFSVTLIILLTVSFVCGIRLASGNDPFFYRAVQRLDMYLAVIDETPDFLQILTKKRLFLPERESLSHKQADEADTPILDSQLKKFSALSYQRKKQIRDMHITVESARNSSEVVLTLQNYYLWLKSLQSYEKTELRKPCPVDEKIKKIAELKERLDDSPVVSELLRFSQEAELAGTLTELTLQEKEELLNNPPELILNYLQQEHKKNE
jgi:hypothetical protein